MNLITLIVSIAMRKQMKKLIARTKVIKQLLQLT